MEKNNKSQKAAGTSVERKPRSVTKDAGKAASGSRRQSSKSAGRPKAAAGKASKSKDRKQSPAGKGKVSAAKGKAAVGKKSATKKDQGKTSSRSKSTNKEEGKLRKLIIPECIAKGGKKGKKAGEVASEDENAVKPTRAIAAYIFYTLDAIPKIKEEEGLSHPMAMKKAGELWNNLSEEAKKPYVKKHDNDVAR